MLSLPGAVLLPFLHNHFGDPLHASQLIVAYHRPCNLGNILTPHHFWESPGAAVLDFLVDESCQRLNPYPNPHPTCTCHFTADIAPELFLWPYQPYASLILNKIFLPVFSSPTDSVEYETTSLPLFWITSLFICLVGKTHYTPSYYSCNRLSNPNVSCRYGQLWPTPAPLSNLASTSKTTYHLLLSKLLPCYHKRWFNSWC
jgi:hypothetical protein